MVVPVIDFSKLDGEERANTMAQIHNGCEEWGFFQLVNHGIPEELLERVKKVSSDCYRLEREENFNNSKPVTMLNEIVEKKKKLEGVDWEDVFLLTDDNDWPSKLPGFKETMAEYRAELKKLAEKMMEIMDENLGLPKGYIKKAFNSGGSSEEENEGRIECGPFGTFVGVYDGHGGPEAARFVCDHLFRHLQAKTAEIDGVVTAETIKRAFRATEEGFLDLVSQLWSTRPQIATVGSCCLVGVILQHTLFVANLGDSRAVLGRKNPNTGGIDAIQLTSEHNANEEAVRRELRDLHPDDPQIVMLKHGVWRVKGIIQVSRSIGDVYMKHAQYNREPINVKFRLSEPIHMPILTAIPSIVSHHLQPNDSFLIFASDGLWEHLTNETAVDIVQRHPHAGSAKRLVKAALHEAARKREMRFSDLQKIDKKVRRHFHDDISVIVLFLNHDLIRRGVVQDPPFSIRSALEH